MKKLNLNVANLNATEVLSREELKHVLGGAGSGSDSDDSAAFPGCASTKIKACANKKEYASCCFIQENGGPSYGKCVSIYGQASHCSDVR